MPHDVDGHRILAELLVANAAPHLATAATGRRHVMPLAGRDSGPGVNAAWAGLNLAAGVTLLRRRHGRPGVHWDRDLLAFELGCLTWSAWMAASGRLFAVNHRR